METPEPVVVTDVISVDVIFPEYWTKPTLYKLREPIIAAGIQVPAGFVTDGASVPRVLWWLFPPMDKYFKAACVHDYLLVQQNTQWETALRYFRAALIESNIPKWRRILMVKAVSLYGWFR